MRVECNTNLHLCIFITHYSFLCDLPDLIWDEILRYLPNWRDKLRLCLLDRKTRERMWPSRKVYARQLTSTWPWGIELERVAELPPQEMAAELERALDLCKEWKVRSPQGIPLDPEQKGELES